MSPTILFAVVLAYFLILLGVAWSTSRHATNDSFFIGNKNSHWMLVAFGMVGTTLTGVTFISVPGAVGRDGFGYIQLMIGYVLGYLVITFILLPLYYRLQLTSIYRYLELRLGRRSYQSGAAFFILSRLLGATARLYLVVNILQATILDSFGVPFWLTALVVLVLILLYTYEGGVKTIVWTDTLQTACMLAGLLICVVFLLHAMDMSVIDSLERMRSQGLARIFTLDPDSPAYVWKHIVAGIFITVAMTGMDQEMMQKNISVRTLRDSQKNMLSLTVVLTCVLLLFLFLGGLLHLYAPVAGVTATGDKLFPAVVLGHFPAAVQLIFFIALISALFPSVDGALTALTSTFCIDILGLQRRADLTPAQQMRWRRRVHLGFAALFLVLIMAFKWVDSPSMIGVILKLASYTYGPLLGLFAFGLLTRRGVRDRWVPLVAVAGPLLCALIEQAQTQLFAHYRIGLELLILNGALVMAGLLLISTPAPSGVKDL
ncbi:MULTISPECIES: sodium:solute symporter [unclassified Janthinobacterium]|uniref:sodium:solute symporter n=1 Tax=unclassified Janthinobacterium TaxID=2610881 RepID=UPI00161EC457|nr:MULTISPECIES: sodium:solute symporter [unclassified Janthinobacterium]MBB5606955.1 Na+/proline symporter [Janthinobacterium sp. S3T4]MBB5612681.1 Na+/proline symporter [Janthinobacterium sp. S3M3]